MKPHKAQCVWHHWLQHRNTMQIARIIEEPEHEVDKVLHQYLQRRYEVRTTLKERAHAGQRKV